MKSPRILLTAFPVLICIACDRGSEQFEGIVNDCTVTNIVTDAVLFIDRPSDSLSIFWGTGEPGADQFTISEMAQAEEKNGGVELNFAGEFNFAGANGETIKVEHDAQLIRADNSYTGILEVRTTFTQGTAECDVSLDLVE